MSLNEKSSCGISTLQGEPVSLAIRDHQTSPITNWDYSECIRELHLWVQRFNQDFELRVPTPVIAIGPLRWTTLATYQLGHSPIGTRTTITFNEGWILSRPFSDSLVTLIHELLHAYEEWHLGREVGGWYHTKAWRDKMAEVGIIAGERGITERVLPCFVEYLERYGVVQIPFPNSTEAAPSKRMQRMRKFCCGCTTVRCATSLEATCNKCGTRFCQA